MKNVIESGGMSSLILFPGVCLAAGLLILLVYCSNKHKDRNKCYKLVNMVFVKLKDMVCFNLVIRMIIIGYLSFIISSGVGRNMSD